ncbi:serine protease Do [Sphingobium wenxiniae]|uniref:Probable periplasmic serine endoprotease DegP-like n=2 Tax=Sphingobium TaxID=165695 RepID=T0HHI1_9SPHN|nr:MULTISPECIES: Do family serine endopeptidase [Sphingobium]EQA97028.1 protease [Sphingobium baderi LL03]KMS64184.1 protease [Sphingobium baderi LL03]MBB6192876.1 serine protease Do [Sphingobium wenxiniae]TWH95315.1 serine protease Do [Sphingobium wenxiniae]WRD78053.1 Do family serine endopeptidase [Sphingobium baderi]
MRYAYAITGALLLGGTAIAVTSSSNVGAQTAQNEGIQAAAPAGAPASLADMVEKLQPAVVNISTKQRVQVQNPFAGTPFGDLFGFGQGGGQPQTRQAQSLGSGFIISPDGYIVTNNHVVSAGAEGATVDSITVTLTNREEYPAKLVGRDPATDIAVLKIDAKKPMPFVKFGDSTRARVGDWVVAIGNPFALSGTVTAGIISALHRGTGGTYDKFIQTDASINQGNSGGPMFDMRGNVIGINSQILSPSGGNVGIGFAIPSEQAAPIVETLRKGQAVKRGYLGIQITPLGEDMADSLGLAKNRGEFVQGVEPGKGAEKAGIRAGDVIVSVAGQEVTPDQNLSSIVANQAIGARVPIVLIRNGQRQTVTAVVGERPPEDQLNSFAQQDDDALGQQDSQSDNGQAAQKSLGISAIPLTPGIVRQLGIPADTRGIVITAIDASTDAGAKGLRRGDVIISANNRPVASQGDLDAAVKQVSSQGRSAILLQVLRRGQPPIFLPVRLRDK